MRIALSTCPPEGEAILNCNPKYVLNEFIKYPPLALLAIVRDVAPHHEVELYDANEYTFDDLLQDILAGRPDLLGISLVTERLYSGLRLASKVKQELPETCIVVGGPHTALYPQETMTHPEFDFMLTGPCELTFPRFVEWYERRGRIDLDTIDNAYYRDNGSEVKHTQLRIPRNIDGFPFPDRKRLDIRKYVSLSDRGIMTTMNSSRGCPFRCRFCNVPRYYMTRSARFIVDEIEEILSLGFNEIHILDDTFNINRARTIEICDLILQRNLKFRWSTRARLLPFDDEMACAMRDAGCFRLNVGVESHDPEILAYIRKGISREDILRSFKIIHKYGFESLVYFIIGFPNQTVEQALETQGFIKVIKPTFVLMNTLLAVPFSDFYFELIESGVYERDYWREYVLKPTKDFLLPSWRGEALDRAFFEVMGKIMKEFYLSPRFIAREVAGDIRHLRFRQLARKVKMGLRMMR